MLAAKYTLRGTKRFERVEQMGKITQSDSFGIAVFDRKDEDVSNYGFIVSNKISPESTNRNRVKRALKAAVRYELGQLKSGMDIVFLAKQKILRKSTEDIIHEVRIALKEANLYK
ncbi:MAG: ribonuclease P protein component [Patescibacteria group bacterium]